MKSYEFRCMNCGAASRTMKLVRNNYVPTEKEIESKYEFTEMGISGEVLLCECGIENTWYSMREVETITMDELLKLLKEDDTPIENKDPQ